MTRALCTSSRRIWEAPGQIRLGVCARCTVPSIPFPEAPPGVNSRELESFLEPALTLGVKATALYGLKKPKAEAFPNTGNIQKETSTR